MMSQILSDLFWPRKCDKGLRINFSDDKRGQPLIYQYREFSRNQGGRLWENEGNSVFAGE
jgi:hypothetical protein